MYWYEKEDDHKSEIFEDRDMCVEAATKYAKQLAPNDSVVLICCNGLHNKSFVFSRIHKDAHGGITSRIVRMDKEEYMKME